VFTVTLPAKMARFLARPWAEQREVYRGWWAYAKKEARHYWVRPGPARRPRRRAALGRPDAGGAPARSWAPSCWARTSRSRRA